MGGIIAILNLRTSANVERQENLPTLTWCLKQKWWLLFFYSAIVFYAKSYTYVCIEYETNPEKYILRLSKTKMYK